MQGSALPWSQEHDSKWLDRVIKILIADDSAAVQDCIRPLLGIEKIQQTKSEVKSGHLITRGITVTARRDEMGVRILHLSVT